MAEFMTSRLITALVALAVATAPVMVLADDQGRGPERRQEKAKKVWKREERADRRAARAPAAPAGRHWRRGEVLPPAYRGGVVRDHYRYGLYAPPRGHVWVRVGEDAYLTGPRGQIVAVLRDNY